MVCVAVKYTSTFFLERKRPSLVGIEASLQNIGVVVRFLAKLS